MAINDRKNKNQKENNEKLLGSVAVAGAMFVTGANAEEDSRWHVGAELGMGSSELERVRTGIGVGTYTKSSDYNDYKIVVGKGGNNLFFMQGWLPNMQIVEPVELKESLNEMLKNVVD